MPPMPFTSLNSGKHIDRIVNATLCMVHKVPIGIPCYHIQPGTTGHFGRLAGVCGKRIRKAGYNGRITDQSLQLGRGGRSRS
jgi:hypothetical protein